MRGSIVTRAEFEAGLQLTAIRLEEHVAQKLDLELCPPREYHHWPNRGTTDRQFGHSKEAYDHVVCIGAETHLVDCKGSDGGYYDNFTVAAHALESRDFIYGINFVYVTQQLNVLTWQEVRDRAISRRCGKSGYYYIIDNHPDSSMRVNRSLDDWLKEIRS